MKPIKKWALHPKYLKQGALSRTGLHGLLGECDRLGRLLRSISRGQRKNTQRGTGLMRKIDGNYFSGMMRTSCRVGDSKASACELGMLQKGKGTIPLTQNRIRGWDGVMNSQVGKCARSTQRPHD